MCKEAQQGSHALQALHGLNHRRKEKHTSMDRPVACQWLPPFVEGKEGVRKQQEAEVEQRHHGQLKRRCEEQ
ncbi:hypothetical protein A0H81_05336 [Grifola frondosa]|uniref:Uncharacterized protein n=1 Tax=Grifola frondosa TaxID=5627 RepID=A0A1C7MC46_GRIFR|nr:hypothetical protein A0H81_05336 [Grifola frondosa]